MTHSMFYSLVPSKPLIKTIVAQKDTILIQWSQASASKVNYYLVSYLYQSQCIKHFQHSTLINITEMQANITELEEFSKYLINITAVNSQGRQYTSMLVTTLSAGLFIICDVYL